MFGSLYVLWIQAHHVLLLPVLVVMAMQGRPLVPRVVYPCLLAFLVLGESMVDRFTYSWTNLAELAVVVQRIQELRTQWGYLKVESVRSFFYFLGNRVLVAAVLVPYLAQMSGLTARATFVGLCLTIHMHRFGISIALELVEEIAVASVALRRIQTFLLLDELDRGQARVEASNLRPRLEDCGVVIDNLTAAWNPNLEQRTLEQVSATVKAGQLLAVIGPVGSGKSSLLMAILGELLTSSGKVTVKGKVTYVSQQPWVFSGSLRQNILFGSTYDKARFDKVVRASAMTKDLEIMPHGDSTLIGDRGVSLSGGQRARVSLARALYTDADIFLLDDPLSAVDAAVGRHLFEKCVQGVLRKKPRILVTHQLQYLTTADSILILKEGRVMGVGTYEELSNSGIDFAELLKTCEEEESSADPPLSPISDPSAPSFLTSQMSLVSNTSDLEPEPVQLPEEEERQTGTVGLRVYVEYFRNGAGCFKVFLLVFFNLVAQGTYIMSDWWLSYWSNQEEARLAAIKQLEALQTTGLNTTTAYTTNTTAYTTNTTQAPSILVPEVDSRLNIAIFSGIIVAVFVFGMVRALLFFKVAVDASQKMHNNMFSTLLRSPIGFFDTNPVGRILNRFAKDVGHMDDNLPITFFDFIQCFLMILGIVLVSGVVNPWVFIPTTPLILIFFYIRHYYLATSRSIKRLEGTCRSPVFSYLSASLQGLHTIRAFRMEGACQEEFDAHQNLHSEAWFLFLSTSRWLAVRLDWLCAVFVTTVAFCSVLAADSLNAGLVGLSITYSMTLMGMFQWGVRQSAEVENQMISVERVLEYSRLPSEANLESEEKRRPPASWPSGGAIQATNMGLRYFPSTPLVLKDITFRIREKEKVGIVGRTGAGKSSLITCLFRLVEPSGKLLIDGVDILRLGLHDLRKNISIIPQDPVLFTGTLRRNLDPFLHHGDDQLWVAMAEVQLKSAVEELAAGLETLVSEGGVNFSVGQRQLICLARAILLKNRILLIDEATANVDPRTDELIQETIRDKFRDCTVLTIAHRLHTIMDSDRVMVLSEGRLMEFEAPHLLLQRGSGLFHDMVQQTGKTEADLLANMAAEAFLRRQQTDSSSSHSSGIESAADPDLSANANNVHGRRRKNAGIKKPSICDEMDVAAPIAVAESFHSLLGGGGRQEDDVDDDDDDDDDEEGETGEQSGDEKSQQRSDGDEAETLSDLTLTEQPSPDVTETTPTEEPTVTLTPPPAPQRQDPSQNPLNKSALTDTSLEDDVFAEDPEAQTALTAVARSNFHPAAGPTNQPADNEQTEQTLLPDSGIGTDDVNESSSDLADLADLTSGVATQLDTPESEVSADIPHESDSLPAKEADQRATDVQDAGHQPSDSEAEPLLTGELVVQEGEKDSVRGGHSHPDSQETAEEREVEDSSELDALIPPGSAPHADSSIRS